MGHAGREVAASLQPGVSADSMNEAWALTERAQTLAENHEPAAALADAQRAYDLSRDPTLLLEVARLERKVGNAARSTHAFELFLAQCGDRVSEQSKLLAARQLQAAAAGTARLAVQTNVLGASVELEPQRGVATGTGFVVSVLLDAGERRVSFSKPGYETRTLQLKLDPGETRTLRVDLDKADGGRSETGSEKPRWSRL
jgi:PEGA domain